MPMINSTYIILIVKIDTIKILSNSSLGCSINNKIMSLGIIENEPSLNFLTRTNLSCVNYQLYFLPQSETL